jgi:hypothetical protein
MNSKEPYIAHYPIGSYAALYYAHGFYCAASGIHANPWYNETRSPQLSSVNWWQHGHDDYMADREQKRIEVQN